MAEATSNVVLARDSIVLGQTASDMEEVIEFVGGMLVDRGIVKPGYIAGMKQREVTVSTYLGNGVALPHGTLDVADQIKGTGIVVAQYPDGIAWGDGVARLVIGLAAIGDDHIEVLSQLAEVLQDEELCEKLWATDDVDFVLETLLSVAESDEGEFDTELSAEVTILNPSGLHARPAALVVELAKGFESEVTIAANGKTANAKSILSVLALGGTTGDVVGLTAVGSDAESAMEQISAILTATEEEL